MDVILRCAAAMAVHCLHQLDDGTSRALVGLLSCASKQPITLTFSLEEGTLHGNLAFGLQQHLAPFHRTSLHMSSCNPMCKLLRSERTTGLRAVELLSAAQYLSFSSGLNRCFPALAKRC